MTETEDKMVVKLEDEGETVYLGRAGRTYELSMTADGVLEVKGVREHGWGLAVVPQGLNWVDIVSTDQRVRRLTKGRG